MSGRFTAWNGPRFFGLRIDKGTAVSRDPDDAPPGAPKGRHLAGTYFFVLMVMVWGMNSVPAQAESILVTIDNLVFSPMEVKAKVGDTMRATS